MLRFEMELPKNSRSAVIAEQQFWALIANFLNLNHKIPKLSIDGAKFWPSCL